MSSVTLTKEPNTVNIHKEKSPEPGTSTFRINHQIPENTSMDVTVDVHYVLLTPIADNRFTVEYGDKLSVADTKHLGSEYMFCADSADKLITLLNKKFTSPYPGVSYFPLSITDYTRVLDLRKLYTVSEHLTANDFYEMVKAGYRVHIDYSYTHDVYNRADPSSELYKVLQKEGVLIDGFDCDLYYDVKKWKRQKKRDSNYKKTRNYKRKLFHLWDVSSVGEQMLSQITRVLSDGMIRKTWRMSIGSRTVDYMQFLIYGEHISKRLFTVKSKAKKAIPTLGELYAFMVKDDAAHNLVKQSMSVRKHCLKLLEGRDPKGREVCVRDVMTHYQFAMWFYRRFNAAVRKAGKVPKECADSFKALRKEVKELDKRFKKWEETAVENGVIKAHFRP